MSVHWCEIFSLSCNSLQVTDIHISIFSSNRRSQDLKDFLQGTVSLVKPALVLVTGDLTHAKFPDEEGSLQQEEEWRMYAEAINSSVLDRVPWIDFRGNHGKEQSCETM